MIHEETNKLLYVRFIREITHPDWVGNVVLVKKSNEKYITCVDYTDLNKICLKDNYPFPIINQLVDFTACHDLYSFMDAS